MTLQCILSVATSNNRRMKQVRCFRGTIFLKDEGSTSPSWEFYKLVYAGYC